MKKLNLIKNSKLLIVLLSALLVGACSPAHKSEVKSVSVKEWSKQGFDAVSYSGYQWGFGGAFGYGGAKVWYILKKVPDNGITYSGFIQKWGDEYHVYGPFAADAIKPN